MTTLAIPTIEQHWYACPMCDVPITCTCERESHDFGGEVIDGRPCRVCARTMPPSLVQASDGLAEYALVLRNGSMVQFTYCTLHGEYATLFGCNGAPLDHAADRGLDVRIADIVWCAEQAEEAA